jgi:hypothetical protein
MLLQTQFDERLQGKSSHCRNGTAFQGSWQHSQSRGNLFMFAALNAWDVIYNF